MNKHFNPTISEEKFAAWLDGMLPQEEMSQISSVIEEDMDYLSLIDTSDDIDACIANQPDEIPDMLF